MFSAFFDLASLQFKAFTALLLTKTFAVETFYITIYFNCLLNNCPAPFTDFVFLQQNITKQGYKWKNSQESNRPKVLTPQNFFSELPPSSVLLALADTIFAEATLLGMYSSGFSKNSQQPSLYRQALTRNMHTFPLWFILQVSHKHMTMGTLVRTHPHQHWGLQMGDAL